MTKLLSYRGSNKDRLEIFYFTNAINSKKRSQFFQNEITLVGNYYSAITLNSKMTAEREHTPGLTVNRIINHYINCVCKKKIRLCTMGDIFRVFVCTSLPTNVNVYRTCYRRTNRRRRSRDFYRQILVSFFFKFLFLFRGHDCPGKRLERVARIDIENKKFGHKDSGILQIQCQQMRGSKNGASGPTINESQ